MSSATDLTPLERASGVLVGRSPLAAAIPGRVGTTPLEALERAVLPALQRAPCVVSFSGGLDSSFVLAVATRVARREGLPPPIPCTWRFTNAPRAEESAWQDLVVGSLDLPEWVKWLADDDLDLVGPVARQLLTQHGQLHPANKHFHLPIVELAAGGSLLTGVGGDQILSGWRHPGPPGVQRRLREATPSVVRAVVRQHRGHESFPWLTRPAARRVEADLLRERHAEPRSFERRVVWHAGRRDLQTSCASSDLLGAGSDVLVVNPLVDRDFVAALARTFRGRGTPSRKELLADIGSGVLPAAALTARPKAHFLEVFFRSPTRALVSSWDGQGVDADLVDVPALREAWSRWPVPGATAPLVQQVWLAAQPTAAPQFVRVPSTLVQGEGR